jgi:uncharacterized protein (DUF2336 family)
MEARDTFGLEIFSDLGSRNGIDRRPVLLRVLTDLYVQRVSQTAAEELHYTELALRLLEAVDVATRIAVAKRLARYASPPLRVLKWLLRDLPKVAAELRGHPLPQSQSPASPGAAPNPGPSIVEQAESNRENRPTGTYRPIDPHTASKLNELFFAANATERQLILLNLDVVSPMPADRMGSSRVPSTGQHLEAAALARKREDFVGHLARALHIPRQQARRIATDNLGEPIVAAAKALGISRDVLCRILMFLNPAVGHSVERVHALIKLFDEMTVSAAEGMAVIWQSLRQDERSAAKHRPLAWDDETRQGALPGAATLRVPLAPRIGDRRRVS